MLRPVNHLSEPVLLAMPWWRDSSERTLKKFGFLAETRKQHDMRLHYNNSKLKFYIGDVRNFDSLDTVMAGADYVFHAAALKQVPSCEFYPMEAVRPMWRAPTIYPERRFAIRSAGLFVCPRTRPHILSIPWASVRP